MARPLPQSNVLPRPDAWSSSGDPAVWPWHELAPLSPFILADGTAPASQQTTVRLCHADATLYVHFECEDTDIWGTYTQRDDPIYDEEVVEIFLAAGDADPIDYFELEVSPNGVLLDACIHNPTSTRDALRADMSWGYAGLRWQAMRDDDKNCWSVVMTLPLGELVAGPVPARWRANFYRIERPRQKDDEFSCWSPTLAIPADFHKPARFGFLALV